MLVTQVRKQCNLFMASYADCDVIILYVLCKFCVLCFLVLLFLFLIAFELVIMCFVMIEKKYFFVDSADDFFQVLFFVNFELILKIERDILR